ncbi:DNA primase [Helicobacter salomonis]|uniref:DNA primase n=1 Tax=Helicobacter salomonis TaxID=56878 RepID=UPI000CF0EFC9|nr:DNA primase [Helicobacter salomonis]
MITNLDALKAKVQIVEIIGQHLELKRDGAGFKACCPFHEEKSGSFKVSPSLNIFKCFGCGEGGDAFVFLQKYKGIDFVQAIQEVANFYKFDLELSHSKASTEQPLLEALAYAQELFSKTLQRDKKVLEYLESRGVNAQMCQEYDIGYCLPNDVQALQKRYDFSLLVRAGLLYVKGGHCFANYRLTFPLKDKRGIIKGFSARRCVARAPWQAKQDTPKYVNSPTTQLFCKSQMLWNLDKALRLIAQRKQVIVCEGFFDVLGFSQCGHPNAICCVGSAFTQEHLKILAKLECEILFSFDADEAGKQASLRALKLCLEAKYTRVGVISIRSGQKDLGECLQQGQAPELVRTSGWNYYARTLLEPAKNSHERDKNYRELLKLCASYDPFLKQECLQTLQKYLPPIALPALKKSMPKTPPLTPLSTEGRILRAMLEHADFRFSASMHLHAQDFKVMPQVFLAITQGQLGGLSFLAQFRPIEPADWDFVLEQFKLRGLKASLAQALEGNDFHLVSALRGKMLAMHAMRS